MKKIFFAIMATAALASCSQDEVMNVNQEAIGFGEAFVDNAARAIDPSYSNTTNKITKFNVWGTLKGNTNQIVKLYQGAEVYSTKDGDTQAYGEAWWCDQVEYWVPNATYVFAAVANHTSVTADSGLPETITFDYTNGATDLLYTQNPNTVKTDIAATPTTGVNDNKIVNFTFNHLLSKLQFKFINKAASEKHIFRVKDIKISGLPTSGTYTIGGTWSTSGTNGVASFGDATNATTASSTTAVDILTTNTVGITSNDARLVIPNSNTLTITFVKELYYDADGDKVADTNELIYTDANKTTNDKYTTITLNGTGVADKDKTKFEVNGNYVLIAELISGSEINFTVNSVANWADGVDVKVN